jgi:hypothetical protein
MTDIEQTHNDIRADMRKTKQKFLFLAAKEINDKLSIERVEMTDACMRHFIKLKALSSRFSYVSFIQMGNLFKSAIFCVLLCVKVLPKEFH